MCIRDVLRLTAVTVLASLAVALPAGPAQALPAFRCGTVAGGYASTYGHITSVRVGHHPGYDRFVVQFNGAHVPHYKVVPKSSAKFWLDPSGRPVTLRGAAGLLVVMHPSSGQGTYAGSSDILTALPELVQARRTGDFEGYTSWDVGLRHQSCKRVFTLAAPTRLVIDVRT